MGEVVIDTFVRGRPYGQPRARARVVNGHADMYDAIKYPRDHSTKPLQYMEWYLWKEKIKAHFRSQFPRRDPLDVAIRLDLDFHFPRDNEYLLGPKSPKGQLWMKKKPDDDNCKKLVQDAMGNIWEVKPDEFVGIWTDDALVCAGEVRKYYVAREPPTFPGVNIRVTTLEEPEAVLFESGAVDVGRNAMAVAQWGIGPAGPMEAPQRPVRPTGRPSQPQKESS